MDRTQGTEQNDVQIWPTSSLVAEKNAPKYGPKYMGGIGLILSLERSFIMNYKCVPWMPGGVYFYLVRVCVAQPVMNQYQPA